MITKIEKICEGMKGSGRDKIAETDSYPTESSSRPGDFCVFEPATDDEIRNIIKCIIMDAESLLGDSF